MSEKIDKWMMLVIGLVGGWVISTAPGWMQASSHEDWWGIATAVGTISAVITALFLSVTESRRRAKENQRSASLYAASVGPKLVACIKPLQAAILYLDFAEEGAADQRFLSLLEAAEAALEHHSIAYEELAPLIDLGEGVAHRIAQGLALITNISREMGEMYSVYERKGQVFSINEHAKGYAARLDEALDLLKASLRQCNNAAREYVKHPTGEELYG